MITCLAVFPVISFFDNSLLIRKIKLKKEKKSQRASLLFNLTAVLFSFISLEGFYKFLFFVKITFVKRSNLLLCSSNVSFEGGILFLSSLKYYEENISLYEKKNHIFNSLAELSLINTRVLGNHVKEK